MDYAAWKLFIDAVELGSLSKVAVAYGTSQPHISRQIGELEQECGGRLFQRTGRGVVLTEFGQRIAPKVRAWLAGTDQLVNDIHTTAGKPIGKVRLGILPSSAHPLVSTLYRAPEGTLSARPAQRARRPGRATGDLARGRQCRSCDPVRHSDVPKNGDIYLVETSTYLVSAAGDPLTSRPTVPFSALHNLPLVLFCRPNSWRDRLDQIAHERGVSLNVALEADSLSLQTHIVAEGGVYALLGPYAVAAASKERRLQSSKLVDPVVTRHIALAMSRHGELTLACRTVMQETQDIAKSGVAALRRR